MSYSTIHSKERKPFRCFITNEGYPFLLDDSKYIVHAQQHIKKISFELSKKELTHLLSVHSVHSSTHYKDIYYGFCDLFDTYLKNPLGTDHNGKKHLDRLCQFMVENVQEMYNCSAKEVSKKDIIEDLRPGNKLFKYMFSRRTTCKKISSNLKLYVNQRDKISDISKNSVSISIRTCFKINKDSEAFVYDIHFSSK